jgi:hypothetical protein
MRPSITAQVVRAKPLDFATVDMNVAYLTRLPLLRPEVVHKMHVNASESSHQIGLIIEPSQWWKRAECNDHLTSLLTIACVIRNTTC